MLLVTTGCNRAFMNEEPEVNGSTPPAAPVFMSASIAVRATQSDLASNSQNAEDEIAQLRILAFNSATGKLAINKYYGNGERDLYSNQPAGTTAAWRGAFQIVPDRYDFFFIANEDSWPSVKAQLQSLSVGVSTMADLYNKDFAMRIPYLQNKADRTFFPGVAGTPGHLILATRTYKNVLVEPTRNGKGTSAADPQHFEAEGDEKVELIRTLAKVKVRIPNSATAELGEDGKYRIKQFLPPRINKITLKNELPYQSLFLNPFLESNVFPNGSAFGAPVKYSKDWYSATTDAARDYILYDRALTSSPSETGLSVGVGAEVKIPAGATYDPKRRYDCVIWFYVPEHLRQALATDPVQPGMVSGATGLLFEKVGTSGGNEFSIWQTDFAENKQKIFENGTSSKYYELPNSIDYSKFSVVRNNVYDITVSYKAGTEAELRLQYTVLPWVDGGVSSVYAMDAFNVYAADPAFKNALTTVILSTTTKYLASGDYIELKAKPGFTFVVDGAETNTVKYGENATERVFRNYRIIQLKTSGASPALNTPIFDVFNQGKFLYTVNAAAQ